MAARKPTRARPTPSKKPVAKPAKRSKPVAKKPAAKKSVAKPIVAKKAPAKKTVAKKSVAKPVVAKKASAKKTVAKKSVAKPVVVKKPVAKPVVAKPVVAKPVVAKPVVAKKASAASRPTPARDALSALAQKKAISSTLSPVDDETIVDAYMRDVDHPFKAEMQAIRQIILGASPKIAERIKWNAPSFYYKDDLGAFNPRATEFAHLILLFPDGAGMEADAGLLEGSHKARREATFRSMDEVLAKKEALIDLVQRWVELRDA